MTQSNIMRGVRRASTVNSCCGCVIPPGCSVMRSMNSRPQIYSSAADRFSGSANDFKASSPGTAPGAIFV